ncbi:MAG: cobalamin-dependent protein [Actinomycetota bacterium]
MVQTPAISLADAAVELGVHYQTAYRWVRSGRLPATMVDGSYRVAVADVASLQDDRERPSAPPAPGDDRLDRQCLAMQEALFEGDETRAASIVRTLSTNGTPVSRLIEEVLAPPLVAIGAAWHRGETTIYVEHRASAIVGRLLAAVTPNPRGRRRGTALVAALSGDFHHLPTAMATAALREDQWTVEHLGADMPVEEIRAFIESHDVDLVVLSATGADARAIAEIAAVVIESAHRLPVLVGGAGSTVADLQERARNARRPGD